MNHQTPRPSPPIKLAPQDRTLLQDAIRQGTDSPQTQTRAKILLKAADGMANREIARILAVVPETVARVRRYFSEKDLYATVWRIRPSKHRPRLTPSQRQELTQLLRRESSHPRVQARARVLLATDQGLRQVHIMRAAGVSQPTVHNIQRRFVEEGLQAALNDRPRPGRAYAPKYPVKLTPRQREQLQHIARQERKSKRISRRISQRARLLLQLEQSTTTATDQELARQFHIVPSSVCRLRCRFVQSGIDLAIYGKRKKRRHLLRITDQHRRRVVALARANQHRGWTMRRLAREAAKRGIVEWISHESVRQIVRQGGIAVERRGPRRAEIFRPR